jgi:outer membrane autotransporter protein
LIDTRKGVLAVPPRNKSLLCSAQTGVLKSFRVWSHTLISAFCIWLTYPCRAGIEVDAYITDPLSNQNSGSVYVVNTATNKTVGSTISAGSLPIGVAVSPDGRYVYLANNGSNEITVVDAVSHAVVGSISVAAGPIGIAITPNGRYLYVTSPGSIMNSNGNFTGSTVSVIDTSTRAVVNTITAGVGPIGVAVSPDGRSVYVGNNASNTVSVISTATNTVVNTIAIPSSAPNSGSNPIGVAFTPDGRFAYVASNGSNSVAVVNTATNTVVASIPLPAGSTAPVGVAISPDGKFVYVADMNNNNNGGPNPPGTISIIQTGTNSVVGTLTVGNSPVGVALTPTGSFVYVTNSNINSGNAPSPTGVVSVISGSTNTLFTSITLGTTPFSFGSFVGPNIIVPAGGPVAVASDAALTSLGFGNFVDFNGGTLQAANSFTTGRTISLLAGGGTFNPNGFQLTLTGSVINTGALTLVGNGKLTLTGTNTYSGGTNILGGVLSVRSDANLGTGAIFINGGELLGTGQFSTAKAISLGTTGGALAAGSGGTAQFSGAVSGTGVLVIGDSTNTGTVVLTADNTFTGGTRIGAGGLQLGNGGTTGSVVGEIVDNGFLAINHSNDLILDNLVQGNGSLIKLGSNTVTLLAQNTYTGGTIIAGGILQLGTGGTSGSLVGNVIDNGVLAVNRSDTLIFSGNISGSGALQQIGSGTTILTGRNNYSGGTVINSGILQVGNGGTEGVIVGPVVDRASLIFNRSNDLEFAGPISGQGSVTKAGSGILRLTGTNNYTGGTLLTGGTLSAAADANLGRGDVQINNNATLLTTNSSFSSGKSIFLGVGGGTLASVTGMTARYEGRILGSGGLKIGNGIDLGEIVLSGPNAYSGGTTIQNGVLTVDSPTALGFGDVVVRGGTLRADPQAINVNGNYLQSSGGTLQLAIQGSAPGQYDFLNVSGRATLGGTLQLVPLNGFQPRISDRLTLVTAGAGVSGRFAQVLESFAPLLLLNLVYEQKAVLLEFETDFAAFAQTPNQLAVARQLDRVSADPREADLIAFLSGVPIAELPANFEKISPDDLTSFYEISFSAANVQASNLEERFAEIRRGTSGFASSLRVSNAPVATMGEKDGKVPAEAGKNVLTPSPENKWGIWISGSGDYIDVSGDGNGKGYDFTTGGVTFGVDYLLTKNFAVGLAGDYAHTWTNLAGSGSMDVDSGRGGIYASFFQDGFHLNGFVGGGYNSYDARRDALGGKASGSTESGEFDSYLNAGYELTFGSLTFGPVASLQYTYLSLNGYNERNSLTPLRIASQSQDSLRSNLGVSAAYTGKVGKIELTPSLRALWQHEYFYSALPISAQFASGAGSEFTVTGPAEGHDSALIQAGLNIQWTPTFGTYFGYNGQVGRNHYDSQGGVCSLHWSF